jgi:peptide-methionine (S)-S-oxide reductase
LRASRHLLLALAVILSAPAARSDPEAPPPPGEAVAVFAGGCFWCMEGPFDATPGVVSTTSGYTGGGLADPTYEQVSEGKTGHLEAVRVVYDPTRVDYAKLLDVFWRNVDPLDAGGQFCDRGPQYRSAIFVADAPRRQLAEASKQKLADRFGASIATEIRDAGPFYAAEEYHQDYYRKNPIRYRFYRSGCGRDARLEKVWGAAPPH